MYINHIFLVIIAIISSAIGQVLFKKTAMGLKIASNGDGSPLLFLINLIQDYYFWGALVFYGAAVLGWVYVLQHLALSRAYPFMALGYVIIPALSWFIFKEPLSMRYVTGVLFIMAGIIIIGFEKV